jgi:hypothetical protein
MIDVVDLKQKLHYDPATGIFTWLINTSNGKRKVGDVAGHLKKEGYIQIKIDKQMYYGQVLAWLYMTGEHREGQVDHRNRITSDNRWKNLRLATPQQNQFNVGLRTDNTSGFKGVCYNKRNRRWLAYLSLNRKRVYLGYHDSAELAHQAYKQHAEKFHGEYICV